MKAYESVLDSVWEFARSDGGVVVGVIVLVLAIAVFTSDSVESDIHATQVAWCLDNGGRRVRIDGATDCFQLTEVPLEAVTFNSQRNECVRVPTQVYMIAPGDNSLHFCYSFKRVTGEN